MCANNSFMKHVVIAETSVIIRSGLAMTLKRLPNFKIQPIEVLSVNALNDCLITQHIDILIVNPTFGHYFDVDHFKMEYAHKGIRVIALITSFIDATLLSKYDESVSIFDDLDAIAAKLTTLQEAPAEETKEDEQDVLSQREKEIVICVVKGMTNKEIAERLFLSVHTVITHRKNISKKLQIHSAAGLTIYAIVNKLVELDEVKGL